MARTGRKIVKTIAGVIIGLLVLAVLIPVSLYIPVVQSFVKDVATSQVSKATGWDVKLDRIMLSFPLNISLSNLSIVEQTGDTLIAAGQLDLSMRVAPILRLKAVVDQAGLTGAYYRMDSDDGSMSLTARIGQFTISGVEVDLMNNAVTLPSATLDGGAITMTYDADLAQPAEADTTEASPWLINVGKIEIKNISYQMRMLPTIDNLDTRIGLAALCDASINTGDLTVALGYLGVDSLDCVFLTPTAEYLAEHPVDEQAEAEEEEEAQGTDPWTITADSLRVTRSHAVYAMSGVTPAEGLDMNYIEVADIKLSIDNFLNRGANITVPISGMYARERSGLQLGASGVFQMDDQAMTLSNFNITTAQSRLFADARVDNQMLTDSAGGSFRVNAEADISISEVADAYPDLKTALPDGISHRRVTAMLNASGTLQQIDLPQLTLAVTDLVSLSAEGTITDPTDTDRFGCDIALSGSVGELNFLKPALLEDSATHDMINLAPMTVDGLMTAKGGQYSGDLTVTMQSGDVALGAFWDGNATDYNLAFEADSLQIDEILPTLGIGHLTARGTVTGHGTDIADKATNISADITVDSIVYNNVPLSDISLTASLDGGAFSAQLESDNKQCGMSATAAGTIDGDLYTFDISASVDALDLLALGITQVPCNGSLRLAAAGRADLAAADYDLGAQAANIGWTFDDNYYYTDSVNLKFKTDSTMLAASVANGDFSVDFNAQCGLDSLTNSFARAADIAMAQVEKMEINIDTIQSALPTLACDIELGQNNIVQQYLDYIDFKHEGLKCRVARDSNLYMYGRVDKIQTAGIQLDTTTLVITEYNKRIGYHLHVGNRQETMQEVAAADLAGAIYGHSVKVLLSQTDHNGDNGFRFGFIVDLSDTTVMASLVPVNPIIAYKQWTVNEDNQVSFNYLTKRFNANLTLAYDNSQVSLVSQHTPPDSAGTAPAAQAPTQAAAVMAQAEAESQMEGSDNRVNRSSSSRMFGQEDITLLIKNVQIADWLAFSPLAPPVKAVLGSTIKLKYDGDKIWGAGRIALDSVVYSKKSVGDFDLKAFIDLNANGGTEARAALGVDGRDCVKLAGSLQDSTAAEPFKLALTVDRFPLALANAFLPKNTAEVAGYLNGDMKVSGEMLSPILDGYISCDSTAVSMPVFGAAVEMPSDKIPVDSSVIRFNQYSIKGMNDSPLTIDGYVDTKDLSNQYIDLSIKGDNVQFVSAKQTRKSQLFGKGYINLSTQVKGYLSDLDVKASLTLLAGSNVTYVMQEDISTLAAETDDGMVKFVQFTDSSYVLADSLETAASATNINLNASINFQSGSAITVYVSQNGSDRAEIKPSGELNFAYTRLGDMTLNGVFNIDGGYVRYSPPIISQVNFTFNSGSYIRWTGDIMNPTLNLSAYENHKTTVTSESSGSRVVEFIVSMYVQNTLSSMDVSFDLATNDDITIQNELSSMSASQRSDQAINLMLYNTYTGSDSQSSGDLATNSLYSFLSSKLNSWAASTMKGVDVTFGVDQYSQTEDGVSSTETTYSYQVSKSLLDDRFKIVVGGSYTPNSSSGDDVASDLFNDVSLEYMLNKTGSMYVRLFNKSGYFNLLEGKVTQTGVGFVYKRKHYRFKDIFRLSRRRKSADTTTESQAETQQDSTNTEATQ